MIGNFLVNVWQALPTGLMLARCGVMAAAFTAHELAHGLVAAAFGDPTPRESGRLTLNPLRHVESIGVLLGLLMGLGWSRPTPIRPYRMRRPEWLGGLLAALAGPSISLLLAGSGAAGLRLLGLAPAQPWHAWPTTAEWLTVWANFNLMLVVLNLLPLFPLDGYHAIHNVLPLRASAWWEKMSGWTTLVFGLALFAFLWLPSPLLIVLAGPPIRWFQQTLFGW
jgi:Zn-dependent protease